MLTWIYQKMWQKNYIMKKLSLICVWKQWKVALMISYSRRLWCPCWPVVSITGVTYLKLDPWPWCQISGLLTPFLPDRPSRLPGDSLASAHAVTGRLHVDGWQSAPEQRWWSLDRAGKEIGLYRCSRRRKEHLASSPGDGQNPFVHSVLADLLGL